VHGKLDWPEYKAWHGMLMRCYWKQGPRFKDWGGRGITVCDRWRFGENGVHPFECFIADVGRRPSPGHSIDRIDNDGNYYSDNVRWTTRSQQQRNSRQYRDGIHRQKWHGGFRVFIAGHWRHFKTREAARFAQLAATEC
jgi:hypothetical protein